MSEHEATLLLHLLGAGVMMGIIFFSLTLSIKKPLEVEDIKRLNYIRSFGLYVIFFVFLTGLHLFQSHYTELPKNPLFIAKMLLIVIDGVIAERIIKTKIDVAINSNLVGDETKKSLPLWAWISALVMVTVFTLGFILEHSI